MKNLHHHTKKEFQVERLVLFSDAVFAIAITLLIIDIKVPEIKGLPNTEHSFLESLGLLMPQFFGFLLSFFFISLYWFIHHKMFGYVINYNGKLIWLNLLFLFSVILMPFSTAVYSRYSTPEYILLVIPYAVYVANICLSGVVIFLMWRFIGNPKNNVAEGFPGGNFLRIAQIRSLLLPLIFVVSLLVAIFINPIIARFVLFLIPVIMSFVKNKKEE